MLHFFFLHSESSEQKPRVSAKVSILWRTCMTQFIEHHRRLLKSVILQPTFSKFTRSLRGNVYSSREHSTQLDVLFKWRNSRLPPLRRLEDTPAGFVLQDLLPERMAERVTINKRLLVYKHALWKRRRTRVLKDHWRSRWRCCKKRWVSTDNIRGLGEEEEERKKEKE